MKKIGLIALAAAVSLSGNMAFAALPQGATPLAYIKGDKNPYLDTGWTICPTSDVFEAVPDYMGVEELADSAVVLRFTVACKEQNVFIARRRLNRELRILFAEKGIEVPFPQVTVWKGEQD